MNIKNTKAEILQAYELQTVQLDELHQKLNVALALLASLVAINLIF